MSAYLKIMPDFLCARSSKHVNIVVTECEVPHGQVMQRVFVARSSNCRCAVSILAAMTIHTLCVV